jgi:hypothetical protein
MSVIEKCGDESINRLPRLQQQIVLLVQQCLKHGGEGINALPVTAAQYKESTPVIKEC